MKVKSIVSSPEKNIYFQDNGVVETVVEDVKEGSLICVFPHVKKQTVDGFGGAFTEATGYCYSHLSDERKQAFLKAYFDRDEGIAYNYCRTHINSCDFSFGNYVYSEKTDLSDFTIERDFKYLIPLIHDAQKVGSFQLFASPWSPPAYMKTSGRMVRGGKLKKKYYGVWAEYVKKYIEEYEKEGISIWGVTAQNEPKAILPWETCVFTAEEERRFVVKHLAPKLKKIGKKIMFWDHNKDRLLERADVMLADKVPDNVYGIATHWYTGDHFDQIALFLQEYPNMKMISSECCNKYGGGMYLLDNAERYAHEIIGDLNAGCSAYVDWNMMLTRGGGPNHTENWCEAPVMLNEQKTDFELKPAYYYIGHFSKYIQPNAKVVGSSKYGDALEVLAAENPDGQIVVVILNRTFKNEEFTLRICGSTVTMMMPKKSIQTLLIEK